MMDAACRKLSRERTWLLRAAKRFDRVRRRYRPEHRQYRQAVENLRVAEGRFRRVWMVVREIESWNE